MKKIIVIGASSGMGRRIATDFARMGWRVGVAARREDALREIRDQFPDRIVYRTIDVTAEDAVSRFLDLIEETGGMDILLYAAGCGWNDPDLDAAKTRRTLAVNVEGFTRIVNAAYIYYKDTANQPRPGQIAVITSIAGTKGIGVSAAYSASKRYQNTYLEALEQLARRQQVNVAITDIRPGFVDTALIEGQSYPMTMSVNHVAPLIEKAILHRRHIVYIDSRWGILTALWRLIPRPLWRNLPLP